MYLAIIIIFFIANCPVVRSSHNYRREMRAMELSIAIVHLLTNHAIPQS